MKNNVMQLLYESWKWWNAKSSSLFLTLFCPLCLFSRNKTHVDWVKSWIQTLTELQQFVKQYHTTGLVWSGQGTAAVPPPPPGLPPPPPLLPVGDVAPSVDSSLDRSALFKDINKGEAVTSSECEQFFSSFLNCFHYHMTHHRNDSHLQSTPLYSCSSFLILIFNHLDICIYAYVVHASHTLNTWFYVGHPSLGM